MTYEEKVKAHSRKFSSDTMRSFKSEERKVNPRRKKSTKAERRLEARRASHVATIRFYTPNSTRLPGSLQYS